MPTNHLKTILGITIVLLLTAACFQLAFVLAPGLAGSENSLTERHSYIQAHLILWQLGWFNWMLGALGLLSFCALLTAYIPNSEWRLLGLILVALGIAPDLSAEVIFAFVIPHAHQLDPSLGTMALLETLAIQLTGTLGNGLYNLGGLLLNCLLLQNHRIAKNILLAGIPGWLLGLGLSVATALQELELAKLFTAGGMVWSTLWMLAITLIIFRNHSSYVLTAHDND